MRPRLLASIYLIFSASTLRAEPGAVAPAPSAPADPDAYMGTNLSNAGGVTLADITTGPGGSILVAYKHPTSTGLGDTNERQRISVRESSDGGKTWSEPTELTSVDRDLHPSTFRILADGAGRVYLIWKAFPLSGDSLLGNNNSGTMSYRVRENGKWSKLVTFGTPHVSSSGAGAWSWFASVDPQGQLHAVWTEKLKAGDYTRPRELEAGLVRQATITGTTVGEAKEVTRGEAKACASADDTNIEGFMGLRGYVDAKGKAHWASVQTDCRDAGGRTRILYFDGDRAQSVFSSKVTVSHYNEFPPELACDEKGVDHVIFVDTGGDRPAVRDLEIPPGAEPGEPEAVIEPENRAGIIFRMQVARSPKGRLAVLAQVNDTDNQVQKGLDQYYILRGANAWNPAWNVTRHAQRKKVTEGTETLNKVRVDTATARFAAGVFEESGALDLVLVNSVSQLLADKWSATSTAAHDAYFKRVEAP